MLEKPHGKNQISMIDPRGSIVPFVLSDEWFEKKPFDGMEEKAGNEK